MYRTLKEQAEAAGRGAPAARGIESRSPDQGARGATTAGASAGPRKLSYKEQRELDAIEPAILAAEERKTSLEATLADPATYQKDGAAVPRLRAELDAATAEVERLYARWGELEAAKGGGAA
jgi:ATP-binding cassette subfamily F protein uup